MNDIQTFIHPIEGFEIDGVKIEKIYLNYHGDDSTIVEAFGDLREYSIEQESTGLVIRTTKKERRVRTVNRNTPVVESITLTVPESFKGFLEVNGVGSNIIIKSDVQRKLHLVSLNGVDFSLHMEHIDTLVEMNGVNTNVFISDFSGKIDCSGVSNKTIIHNIIGDTSIDISGMSSSLTIHEHSIKNHYSVSLSGISSKLTYYGQRRSSFGSVEFKTHHHEDHPLITIDGSGVSTKVSIDS